MNVFSIFSAMLSMILGLINIYGSVVAVIWLGIIGEWKIIVYGVAILLVSGIGLRLIISLGHLLFARPAVFLLEKRNKIGFNIFSLLSALYTAIILTVWCMVILYFSPMYSNQNSIVPILIWSYGIAVGPIIWMVQSKVEMGVLSVFEEAGETVVVIQTMLIEVAYIIAIIAILFFKASLLNIAILFGIVMIINLAVQLIITSEAIRLESDYY